MTDTSRHMHSLPVKSTTKDQVSASPQSQYKIEPTRQSALEAPPEAYHRATTQSAFLLPVGTPTVSKMSTIEARCHLEQLESEGRRLKAQLTGLQRKDPVSYTHLTLPTNREV